MEQFLDRVLGKGWFKDSKLILCLGKGKQLTNETTLDLQNLFNLLNFEIRLLYFLEVESLMLNSKE